MRVWDNEKRRWMTWCMPCALISVLTACSHRVNPGLDSRVYQLSLDIDKLRDQVATNKLALDSCCETKPKEKKECR